MMETRTIFFIGKPGCGKGTQAKLLSEVMGLPVFSAGKLFRDIAKEDTPVGRKVKSEIDEGLLAPHWFAMYLYLKELFSIPDDTGAIFDGFNRKKSEAELVVDSFNWLGRPFTVFNIAVSDEEVTKRILLRKSAEGRADDSAVTTRLEEYREHTEPALELFRASGHLIEINGEQTPDEVATDVRKALGI
jgi:adenylate kinase